jgi:hypothetical protein
LIVSTNWDDGLMRSSVDLSPNPVEGLSLGALGFARTQTLRIFSEAEMQTISPQDDLTAALWFTAGAVDVCGDNSMP